MRKMIDWARKTARAAAVLVALVALAPVAAASGGGETAATDPQRETVTLAIERIPNSASAAVVEAALMDIDGVHAAEVTYQSRRASVDVDTSQVTAQDILEAIESISTYRVTLLPRFTSTAAIRVPGLDSREVANAVNDALSSLPGIVGGTIRSGIIAVDYNTDLVSTEAIVAAIVDATDLSPSEVVIPATDDPAPDQSAQVVIRIPGMNSYKKALEIANELSVIGVFDAVVDLPARHITFIYAIDTLTAPMIAGAVETFAGPDIEVVTVDRAGKPVGMNVHGWFVVGISTIGLVAAFLLYLLIRRFRRSRIESE